MMSNKEIDMLIEILKQKENLTDIEKNIVDTWKELKKVPFNRQTAQRKIVENNLKYKEIFVIISTSLETIVKPFTQATDEDVKGNLHKQLELLCIKEMEEQK